MLELLNYIRQFLINDNIVSGFEHFEYSKSEPTAIGLSGIAMKEKGK
jgi:hypothetical protein